MCTFKILKYFNYEIDEHLNLSSLKVVNSSFPQSTTITDRTVSFFFENINLPDSTTNEPASHGFVTYKIDPISDIVEGSVIENTANIVFDLNPAIVTNTTVNTMVSEIPTGTVNVTSADMTLFPNPTSGQLTKSTNVKIEKVEIIDAMGRLQNVSDIAIIDLSHLPAGTYKAVIHYDKGVMYRIVSKY